MRTLLIKAIDLYRLCLSPYFGWGCRFEPSCSHYAREAVQRHGAARGTWYTLTRLLRCHPLCPGGFDPVP